MSGKTNPKHPKTPLFDASSIVNMAAFGGGKVVDVVTEVDASVLPLTYYEVGNAIWKMHHLIKKLDREEAISLLEVSMKLLDRLKIIECSRDDSSEIVNLALDQNLTFYDASYLFVATKHQLSLITDDGKLSKIATNLKIENRSSAAIIG